MKLILKIKLLENNILSTTIMKKIYLLFFSIIFISTMSNAQKINTDFLPKLLATKPEQFKDLMDNSERYRLQILYTQIDRDKKNRPKFTTYGYRINNTEYFYPASTVKFPASALALEKINNLNIKGLFHRKLQQVVSEHVPPLAVELVDLYAKRLTGGGVQKVYLLILHL